MTTATSIAPLVYDAAAARIPETGVCQEDLAWLAPRLIAARDEALGEDLKLWKSGNVPPVKRPLDAAFIDLPERLLKEHAEKGAQSEVGQIRRVADRLAAKADRVVVLGIGGSYMGARALFEACCHPCHNELSREARGGRPRICFEGNNVDNDAFSGLVDLLKSTPRGERWAVVVISKSGGTLETAAAFRLLLETLRATPGITPAEIPELVIPVTGKTGLLRDLAGALECRDVFSVPDGVGGRFSVLSAVGLLPAAVMGLDVVRLLEGATAMTERCRKAPPGENPVLDYTAVCHLMETRRRADVRILSTWGKGLEAAGLWYDQLLSESLGKQGQGALPITVVNTRDLHSRGQQHQEGRRDKLITNVIVDRPRRAPVVLPTSPQNQDQLNELAGKSLPDILSAAIAGTNQAYADDRRPTADLHLPQLDEAALGQFFQMFMLATAVEGRLMGINPYGQPGVEAYKKNMNAILRAK